MDLITGANGFIGLNLIKSLKNKRKIRALVEKDSDITKLKRLGVEIVYGDLKDSLSLEKATKGIDLIYHLAGLIGSDSTSYNKFYQVNVKGTENLVQAGIKNNVKKIIFTSSVSVFGEKLNADENTECNPITKYGKSKLEAEQIIKKYSNKLNYVILRLVPIYGYGQSKKRGLTQLIDRIARRKFIIFGKGMQLMPLLYIEDAVNALILSEKANNRTYLISGESITMNELVETICSKKKIKKPMHLPLFMGYGISIKMGVVSALFRIKMPLTLKRFKNMIASRSFSTTKAEKELGWKAKTKFNEVIEKII